MKLFILSTLLLVGCSSATDELRNKMTDVRVSDSEVEACVEYQENVLEAAYTQEDEKIVFIQDEIKARKALASFDTNKGLLKPRSGLVQNILSQCDEASIKKFDTDFSRLKKCTIVYSELNFFQGLATGLSKYPWPTELKLEGKKVALDYVNYFSEGRYPLINRLVALSVLDELSVNKIVNEDLHKEIKQVMIDSQTYVEGLRARLNKDPALTCESLTIIRDELDYADKIGAKIKDFLKRI